MQELHVHTCKRIYFLWQGYSAHIPSLHFILQYTHCIDATQVFYTQYYRSVCVLNLCTVTISQKNHVANYDIPSVTHSSRTLLWTCTHRRGTSASWRAYRGPGVRTSEASVSPPPSYVYGVEMAVGPTGRMLHYQCTEELKWTHKHHSIYSDNQITKSDHFWVVQLYQAANTVYLLLSATIPPFL